MMEVAVVIGVLVVLVGGGFFVFAASQKRANTGRLSRETKSADAEGTERVLATVGAPSETDEGDVDEAARERAGEARRAIGSGAAGGVPATVGERGVTHWEPVDPEELGVTRRQFFNRGILTGLGLGVAGFGAASLAFLWPSSTGGFGGTVTVGSTADIDDTLATKIPFYNAGAKAYIVAYPPDDLKAAAKVYDSRILAGMKQGYVALYQKCPHLGCRVPFCETSQWFECPCHGSKYNRVGEKRGGPAPRGMDRFPLTVTAGEVVVDTGTVVEGPPIGTDTTKQGAEGAPCV